MNPRPTETRRQGEDGAVIVEFAAIFVVFTMLLWGLITYGLIFAAQQSLTHAASDAARSVVGLYPDEGAAQLRADEVFGTQFAEGSWLDTGGLTHEVTFGQCESTASADPRECATVTTRYHWDAYPVVPELLSVATPNWLSAKAVVQWD